MAETIRDVAIQIALKMPRAKLPPIDIKAPVESIKSLEDAIHARMGAFVDVIKSKADKLPEAVVEAVGEMATEYALTIQEMRDDTDRILEGFHSIRSTVMQTADAIAVSMSGSAEELARNRQAVQLLGKAFAVIEGAITFYRTLKVLITATRLQTKALRFETLGEATAHLAAGSAAKVHATGLKALHAAMGPKGWLILGVGLAIEGLILLTNWFMRSGDAGEEAAGSIGRTSFEIRNLKEQAEAVASLAHAAHIGELAESYGNWRTEVMVTERAMNTLREQLKRTNLDIAQHERRRKMASSIGDTEGEKREAGFVIDLMRKRADMERQLVTLNQRRSETIEAERRQLIDIGKEKLKQLQTARDTVAEAIKEQEAEAAKLGLLSKQKQFELAFLAQKKAKGGIESFSGGELALLQASGHKGAGEVARAEMARRVQQQQATGGPLGDIQNEFGQTAEQIEESRAKLREIESTIGQTEQILKETGDTNVRIFERFESLHRELLLSAQRTERRVLQLEDARELQAQD